MAEDLVPRDELRATLAARHELGPDYEAAVLDRFAAELERRIEARLPQPKSGLKNDQKTGIVIVSVLAAIPLLGIAGGTVGLAGVIAVCIALVVVNALALRG